VPTASSGLPDRSDSESRGTSRRARLSKDDDRLLSDGPDPDDELAVDATDDELADDELVAEDADSTDLEDDDDADEEDDERPATGTTLTKRRAAKAAGSSTTATRPRTRSRRPQDQRTGNPFVFLARFVREVVGEMRKVLWPSRRELVVYTIAVIIFVTVMISIVGGLDFGFARLVLLVFG
jgi:preprotein translocase subunit SecE